MAKKSKDTSPATQSESREVSPFHEFERFFDGILELTLPKLKRASRRNIEVK